MRIKFKHDELENASLALQKKVVKDEAVKTLVQVTSLLRNGELDKIHTVPSTSGDGYGDENTFIDFQTDLYAGDEAIDIGDVLDFLEQEL